MFTIKRGICTNKGDNYKFIFARITSLFGLFSEKAATAERCHPHVVLLLCSDHNPFFFLSTQFQSNLHINDVFFVIFKGQGHNKLKYV